MQVIEIVKCRHVVSSSVICKAKEMSMFDGKLNTVDVSIATEQNSQNAN